ncbi:hypothetical protein TNIN_331921 [Trichonephila inaurata madagascariensis]|uniref:Uncharacterized protein n=1 Tax=Trichonephila inaurata madagascariensis TaxID=2747483 RepID=A0A8X6XE88_9ARAC|nr:hypothetical protein TNIN_331921 [Trichonephila inaurata madagascariensis]
MADKQIVNIVPTTSPPTLRRHTPKPAPEGEINRGKGMPRNASRRWAFVSGKVKVEVVMPEDWLKCIWLDVGKN